MNYAEANLIENVESKSSDSELAKRSAALNDTYAYDAAFMVGRDLPPTFVDGPVTGVAQLLEVNDSANQGELASSANKSKTADDSEIIEVEQLTIEQASKILGVTEERVKELIKDDTLCCADVDENQEPRLSAACVRAQAGKSKLEFIQEVKRLIAYENDKHCTTSVSLPESADPCLQEIFDAASPIAGLAVENVIQSPGSRTGRELHVKGIERAEITRKSLATVLETLDFSSVRLEGAMYRIGYLEAKLDDLNKELEVMPEMRSKWAKSLILERENEEYRETIAKREHELLELHQFLNKIKDSWWCRAWCWLTGVAVQ